MDDFPWDNMSDPMTPDERKAWRDSLKPGDDVVLWESSFFLLRRVRARIIACHADCFVVKAIWFDAETADVVLSNDVMIPKSGTGTSHGSTPRIEPMTGEEMDMFGDDNRRAWVSCHIDDAIGKIASDDLRRVAELLGYKEPTEDQMRSVPVGSFGRRGGAASRPDGMPSDMAANNPLDTAVDVCPSVIAPDHAD